MVDDLRYAIRSLLSSRGFTAVSLLIIALSIGAITPIFSIVDAVSLRPLPYPDSDRLVVVRDSDIPVASGRLPMSQRNYLDWAERQQGLEAIAAIRSAGRIDVRVSEIEYQTRISRVSSSFFSVLRQVPAVGRAINDEDVAQSNRVVVITHGFWQRAFGGLPDVVGQKLIFDNTTYEVIGVAHRGFMYPAGSTMPSEIFAPLVIPPAQRVTAQRGIPFLTAIGRLTNDVNISEAQASMDVVAAALRREHPGWEAGVVLQPYHEFVTGRAAKWMRLLVWGVALVFLIMCANVANLLLARGGARRKEVGVRSALGASRYRIARQLVIESMLVAAAGTAAGLLLGWWILEAYRTAIPAGLPRANEIALDWRVLSMAAVAAAVTGGIFGLAPALVATRIDLTSSLKSAGTASAPAAGARLRSLLIVAEVAVALVLLVGALLFTTSFLKVSSIPLGVDYRNVVVTSLEMPPPRPGIVRINEDFWAEKDRFHNLVARVAERVRAVAGVDDVAATSGWPFSGGRSTFGYGLPGRPAFKWSRDQHQMLAMKMVTPNYLQLLRIPLLRGRYLNERDTKDAEGAIVLSESAARMVWPGEDPIGQEIDLQKRLRVVGIVSDVRMGGPEVEPWPDVYVPMSQGRGTTATTLIIKTALPAGAMLPTVRTAIQEVDPSQRVREATTLETSLAGLLAQRRFNMLVVGSFGALGVLIAAIGLYGVITYLVTQRRHEIGIRIALGASRGRILRMVLSRAALLVAAGLVLGGVGVWQFAAVAQAFLFQLDPLDVRVIGAAMALMAVTALTAALVPARRAASVDPLIALRQD